MQLLFLRIYVDRLVTNHYFLVEFKRSTRQLITKNKWSLIIQTEDMGCQAVDTKINMRTRETARELISCATLQRDAP